MAGVAEIAKASLKGVFKYFFKTRYPVKAQKVP